LLEWKPSLPFLLVILPLKHSAPAVINLGCIVEVRCKWKYVTKFCRALIVFFVIVVCKMHKISKLFQTCNTQVLEQIFIFLRIRLERELLYN
jgi:hypothetical protein